MNNPSEQEKEFMDYLASIISLPIGPSLVMVFYEEDPEGFKSDMRAYFDRLARELEEENRDRP
ncbi:hypothetical protein LCGC14_0394530 [marine sediment metagenome]|uniref:Uncharacterized protein n=1 Tax=marine sediment metagenome TaxID=412755 RepID=A0A0F9W7T2_9ZZZZ